MAQVTASVIASVEWSAGSVITASGVTLASDKVYLVHVDWRSSSDQTMTTVTVGGTETGVTYPVNESGVSERIGIAAAVIVGRSGSLTIQANFSATLSDGHLRVVELNADTTTPHGTVHYVEDMGTEAGTLSTSVTVDAEGLAVSGIATVGDTVASMTRTGGSTELAAPDLSGDVTSAMATESGTGTVAHGYTYDGATGWFARMYSIPFNPAAAAGGYHQPHFRFYNDDGNESSSTGFANEDTAVSCNRSTNIRLRAMLHTTVLVTTPTVTLWYKRVGDGANWQQVTTSSLNVRLADSTHIAASAATATTARLTPPSGLTTADFVAGKLSDDTAAVDITTMNNTDDKYTEVEWCVQLLAPEAQPTFVYQFQLRVAGQELLTYAVTPQMTVSGKRFILRAP